MAAVPVAEYTDRNSFQCVPSGIILNTLSFMTVCQSGHKQHQTVTTSQIIPPEMKKTTTHKQQQKMASL